MQLPGIPLGAGWCLSVCPAAGEAGGSFRYAPRTRVARDFAEPTSDPERSLTEAARRARGKLRRYCAAEWLNRLGTLTYRGEGCHDPKVLRTDLAEFFRTLRALLGVAAMPYVWIPEWHMTEHGLHAHFAVGRYVARGHIERAWGRGYVHIKLLGDLPTGSGVLAEARKAAGYLSKYVGKTFDERRIPGLHRYDVAQGSNQRSCMCGAAPLTRRSTLPVASWAACALSGPGHLPRTPTGIFPRRCGSNGPPDRGSARCLGGDVLRCAGRPGQGLRCLGDPSGLHAARCRIGDPSGLRTGRQSGQSETPDGSYSARVEVSATRDPGGLDDGMVEHVLDDGVLPFEVEVRPLPPERRTIADEPGEGIGSASPTASCRSAERIRASIGLRADIHSRSPISLAP